MTPDDELLLRYAKTGSDAAFAELVNRHLGLVYSAALRQLAGDTHRAQDVSQLVFTDLARKALRLVGHPALSAWLYKSTRYAVAGVVRTEVRRKNREKEANAMREIHETSEPAVDWVQIGPVIDEVIFTLNEREREAILLRYFSGLAFAEIGERGKITADAARFRVERALEKMRRQLSRQGISSTAAALALVLETQVCSAAPAGMAAVIAGGAATGAGAAAGLSLLQLMATYKQIGIAVALIAAAGAVATLELSRQRMLRREIASLTEQDEALPALRAENKRLQATRNSLVAGREGSAKGAATDPLSAKTNISGMSSGTANNPGPGSVKRKAVLLDQAPALLDRVVPTYPADLIGTGISGAVRVEFIVSSDGSATKAILKNLNETSPYDVVVLTPDFTPKSSPADPADIPDSARAELEEAALKAADEWVFRPGRMRGREVNTRMQAILQVRPPAPFSPPSQ